MSGLALAVATTAPGCVIPLAPQFEDPEENYPPFIISSTPSDATRFSPMDMDRIVVTIGDQNLGDTLFARWIFDYPPRDPNVTRNGQWREIGRSGTIARAPIDFKPSCDEHNIARGPLQHRLTLSVSDRPFLDAEMNEPVSPLAPLDSPREGAHRLRISWLLELECK